MYIKLKEVNTFIKRKFGENYNEPQLVYRKDEDDDGIFYLVKILEYYKSAENFSGKNNNKTLYINPIFEEESKKSNYKGYFWLAKNEVMELAPKTNEEAIYFLNSMYTINENNS
jgi:hypothetical protein